MSEKHIGEVVQVTGPVLDIRFPEGELPALLNISDNQLSYITNVGAGHGLIRCSGNLVPFENSFPRNTKLYRLMTTKLSDMSDNLVNSTSNIIR